MEKRTPRMRLLQDIYAQLKVDDPNTAITYYALRILIKSGAIPSVQIGRKTLIDYNKVIDYFDISIQRESSDSSGEIRKIC